MGTSSIANPGAHGFTEMLYAFSSMGNNNGSAFAGLNANTPFYNIVRWLCNVDCVVIGLPFQHLLLLVPWHEKKNSQAVQAHLPTYTPLFIVLISSVIIILGALSFFPALALGPIVEQLNALGTIWPLNIFIMGF